MEIDAGELVNWVKQRLKEAREEKRMTQTDVANALGMTTSAMASFEHTGGDIKLSTVLKLLAVYEIHPAVFFYDMPFLITNIALNSKAVGDLTSDFGKMVLEVRELLEELKKRKQSKGEKR